MVAASVHFVQLGDHAAESPYLAAGFLIAGVLQLLLATVVPVQPSRPVYRTVVVLDVFLILLYVGHVLVGIPLPTGAGLDFVFSPRESVDVYGVIAAPRSLSASIVSSPTRSRLRLPIVPTTTAPAKRVHQPADAASLFIV